ncbi:MULTISPECIES: Pycsar system effector family protein [Sorangium]|uniref:Pycsar effector protein domain-containing protein n=1 Tax=Sorangium cellulosum TaxID=56 RepID=A0A4P2QYX4_SORCE|nr:MULTISPECIES: Pycsar system effector family protein [Sorangium]AUX35790.1 uncharacterized protein SOCE836_079890 [Sorangium cellulosum]WCQ95089.1 hypothetical protein NQZ70_07864 [Sorangium sp. Soce836]
MTEKPTTPPPSEPVASTGKDDIDFLLKVIGRYDTYIGTTNTKAAGVVALCALLVGTTSAKWNELVMGPKALQVLIGLSLIGAAVTALLSISYAVQTVFPQTNSPEKPQVYSSLIAYAAVAKHEKPEEYHTAILAQDEHARVLDCAFQAHTLAKITDDKFAKLKSSFRLLTWGVLPCTGIALILRFISMAWDVLR